jgi:hypothetical protein
MPVKLREFYFRELISAKEEEKATYEKAIGKGKSSSPAKTSRRS